jgi:hypothetical protein
VKNQLKFFKYWAIVLPVICVLAACKSNTPRFGAGERAGVKDSVSRLMVNVAADISVKGPIAWLKYFEDTTDFFMASNGQLSFHNYQSASAFIKDTLVKIIPKITLRWSNIRIDALSPGLAAIGSGFHEDITNLSGGITPFDGYFSAVAIYQGKSWKLRNAHWSIKSK